MNAIKFASACFVTLISAGFLCGYPAHASPWYQFDVVAESGAAGLVGFGDRVSINDKGNVAFVGQVAGGESIFVGSGGGIAPTNITPNVISASRRFGRAVQINNSGQVIGRDQVSGSPIVTFIRLWDQSNPNQNSVVARGGTLSQDFDAVFAFPSTNNNKQTVFSALQGAQTFLATPKLPLVPNSPPVFNTVQYTGTVQPSIADDGRIAVTIGTGAANDPLLLYQQDLSNPISIAASTNFSVIGRNPGISDDGKIVVFYGDLTSSGATGLGLRAGPGIFANVDTGGGNRTLLRLTGRERETIGAGGTNNNDGTCDLNEICSPMAELGFDELGATRFFSSYGVNTKISVTNLDLGKAGIDDDTFTVAFIATPNAASRDNPRVPGKPLFYSNQLGIWSLRVDIQNELSGAKSRVFNVGFPVPVVQVNDVINGSSIAAVAVSDSIANAAFDDTGVVRTQRRGDHRVAFWCQTTSGAFKVVRASQLDSDQDGLYDHWETNGIDIDGDGGIDLDLKAMGASPNQRDLFLEIDWLADESGVKFEPDSNVISPKPGAAQSPLVAMFANAPALAGPYYGTRADSTPPLAILAGIALHIDGGAGLDKAKTPFSINMGTGPLQGGDKIAMAGPGNPPARIDVLYFGVPGSVQMAGVNTRAYSDVKDVFFGKADKRARELAFRYFVLGSAHSFFNPAGVVPFSSNISAASNSGQPTLTSISPLPVVKRDDGTINPQGLAGHVVLITLGPGSGEKRTIKSVAGNVLTLRQNWGTLPIGSTFTLIHGSSGRGESAFRPKDNFHGIPGNDVAITLGGFGVSGRIVGGTCYQWRTMAHEMGHTLGLRHGGSDHKQFKGNAYLSLMSYSHQNDCSSGAVMSYSSSPIPTFDDFSNFEHRFAEQTTHLGNTFGRGLGGDNFAVEQEPEQTIHDAETIHGPSDLELPVVTFVAPANGSTISVGGSLPVNVNVTDNRQVEKVFIEFDLNGNGTIESTERIQGINSPGTSNYLATFSGISGGIGSRTIRAIATDTATNIELSTITVSIASVGSVNVPSVVGLSQAAAQTALTTAGLKVGVITTMSSSTVAAGNVISASPLVGTSVTVGSSVNLLISSGPALGAVPNVVGQTQPVATNTITNAGLKVGTVTQQSSATVPIGNVISENPAAGTSVASGSAVNLVVSSGPATVIVPNVVGQTQAAATTAITSAGLKVGTVTTQSSTTVAVGNVISENPAAGTSVGSGSAVNLVVSSGLPSVSVPNVVGQTQVTATNAITGAGLKLGVVTLQASSTIAAGNVISEIPAAGTSVASGSSVNLVVSSGPPLVTVPNVVGQTQAAATVTITGIGLKLGTVTPQASATIPAGNVISENPVAGTSVANGSAVNLVVSSGPAVVTVPNVVGQTQVAATAAITTAGLKLGTVTSQASTTVAAGNVISEAPAAGTVVATGATVNLVVSSGAAPVPAPNVVGQTQAAATSAIIGAGLKLGTVTQVSSSTVLLGNVISQSPIAGTAVASGSAVSLVVSSGPLAGDLNGDGTVTCVDANIVKAAFGKKTGQPGFDARADINKDGVVDVRDLAFVTQRLPLGTKCP